MQRKRIKPKKAAGRISLYVILIILAVSFILPFLWLIASSFKETGNAQGMLSYVKFTLIPRDASGQISFKMDNYINALEYLNAGILLKNTLIVAIANTVINTVFNSMAGYAFARINFKGKNVLFRIIILAMMIPGTVMMIPNLIICREMGIYDSLWALMLPFAMSIYNVFLMRQHFFSFSRELEEAAMIDGAGRLQTFFRIALPMASPMLIVIGVTTFMWNYNNFLWPLVATSSEENRTLALGLGSLISAGSTNPEIYPVMLAGSVVLSLPMIILFFLCQKHIIGGISAGAVKE
ncbi:carbohydrate ABC transporter permease [uncultured Eubacterium sp.]|uniref:carbohydrate ABC transporter permease n=1 Tax=uncultured Eubacterium sp. TaxID=165185 RepID=UPI00267107C6|nr:carbohydrate ABC transporter permease [uncultured Eubacterium sp.]